MIRLYHFTCHHGFLALGEGECTLLPALTQRPDLADRLPWQSRLLWLTDLDRPNISALGLTSVHIGCDRTQHRYRITESRTVARWGTFAHDNRLPRWLRDELEQPPGMPGHWWVSSDPVPAVYDPVP